MLKSNSFYSPLKSVNGNKFTAFTYYYPEKLKEAAKNYIGNIKAYHSTDFKILNEEIND